MRGEAERAEMPMAEGRDAARERTAPGAGGGGGRGTLRACPRRRAAAAPGFTLLEMVVVVIIMGIVFAISLPGVGDGLRRWRLQAAVRDFATTLKFTRNQAVAGRAPLDMILDRTLNVYWVDRPVDGGVPTAEQAMERGVRVYELSTAIRFGEVLVGGVDPALERIAIRFFPRGNSTGGEVKIQDEKGRAYVVSVDLLTGQAHIQR